ncbi:MAG TPA: hypothetical protein PLV25_05655, partial [Opitutales bacterium]|nr:hypothetical protein [Opitutales bacterium]
MIKKLAYLCFVLLLTAQAVFAELGSVVENTLWTVCIDGGGTKTTVSIISAWGMSEEFCLDGAVYSEGVMLPAANIPDPLAVQMLVDSIFELKVWDYLASDWIELGCVTQHLSVVAGISGAGSLDQQNQWMDLLAAHGVSREHIYLRSDVELALETVGPSGLVLICGTGSVCLGKRDEQRFRAGGLGWFLGDEGSGFRIAKAAIAAALAQEVGAGPATSLAPCVSAYLESTWGDASVRALSLRVFEGRVLPKQIAAFAPQ